MEYRSVVSSTPSEQGSPSGTVQLSEATATGPGCTAKVSTLERNNQKWDTYKDDIRLIYMERDKTLQSTMQHIELVHGFTASARKWKMKLKEWNFEKNIPAKEMGIMVEIAEKRKRDEGKETVFLRGDLVVPNNRIEGFKKRRVDDCGAAKTRDLEILENITYRSPKTNDGQSEDDQPEDGQPEDDQGTNDDAMNVDSGYSTSPNPNTPGQSPLECIDPSELLKMKSKVVFRKAQVEPRALFSKTDGKIIHLDSYSENSGHFSSIHRDNQLKSTQPTDAIRRYIKTIFESICFTEKKMDISLWAYCLSNLSGLLNRSDVQKKRVQAIFREEFKLVASCSRSSDADSDKHKYTYRLQRLQKIWAGYIEYSSWSEKSQGVAEWFIHAFPKSKRWRFRLELSRAMSDKHMHPSAMKQLLLSLSEVFIQWKDLARRESCHKSAEKIIHAISFKKHPMANAFLIAWFPGVKILEIDGNIYTRLQKRPTYLIACLAKECFSKDLWDWGNDLVDTIKTDSEDKGHDESWVILYLDLFDIYFQAGRLSDAVASMSRAIYINLWGIYANSRRRDQSLLSKEKLQRRWNQVLKLPPREVLSDEMEQSESNISALFEQWITIYPRKSNLTTAGPFFDKHISAKSMPADAASVCTAGTGGKSEIGDCDSSGIGITYTESLFSEMSLSYSDLFRKCSS